MNATTTATRTTRGGAASTMWRPLLIGALLPCAVTTLAASAVAWWTAGEVAGWSAFAGAALVTGFFMLGFACLRLVLAGPTSMQTAGALAVFFVQILVLMALVDIVGPTPPIDSRAFAFAGLAAAVVWQLGQAVVLLRTRRLAYGDLPLPGERA